jgi:hypothetical protein
MRQQLMRHAAVTQDLLVSLCPQQSFQHGGSEQLQLQGSLSQQSTTIANGSSSTTQLKMVYFTLVWKPAAAATAATTTIICTIHAVIRNFHKRKLIYTKICYNSPFKHLLCLVTFM